MTEEEWFVYFDMTSHTFKWFILHYFGEHTWKTLMNYRKDRDKQKMMNLMGDIWFDLPDSQFNLMKRPKGWKEFLNLVEV